LSSLLLPWVSDLSFEFLSQTSHATTSGLTLKVNEAKSGVISVAHYTTFGADAVPVEYRRKFIHVPQPYNPYDNNNRW
jgi:hypothetical protein